VRLRWAGLAGCWEGADTAEDPDQLQAGLAALAGRLCPAIALAGTTAEAAGWAVGWLQAHQGWLLVLDNVTEPADVEALLGQLTGGHILVTTRRDTGWDQAADPVRLDVLDPGPATDLLTTRTGQHKDASRAAAVSVAGELGGLPLALDQAAAYVTQTRITLGGYLGRLRQHPQAMYAATGGGLAQRTIARIWDITIGAIGARDPGAIELLSTLACYAPDDIPRTIIAAGQLAADEALGLLASYSMITLTADTVSVHRLVQAVILAQHPPATTARNPAVRRARWPPQPNGSTTRSRPRPTPTSADGRCCGRSSRTPRPSPGTSGETISR
jgi:hypothetical protein